jgi:putative ABC transport system permease protein
MGRSNIPLLDTKTVSQIPEQLLLNTSQGESKIFVMGWPVSVMDLSVLISSALLCIAIGWLLYRFLLTHFGTALRATGNNAQMVRAQGINNNKMIIFGLAFSNGLVALSGALLAQYQGFADVQMGIGMMVWGLASIIIGEALVGKASIGTTIVGAILGTVLFRLLIAIALRWGLNPNDLKLVTALFVFAALVAPQLFKSFHKKLTKTKNHA